MLAPSDLGMCFPNVIKETPQDALKDLALFTLALSAPECTQIAHRHLLAIFHCRLGYHKEFPQFWGRKWLRQFYGRLEKCVRSAG